MAKGPKDYHPFYGGIVSKGTDDKKCPICGIAKRNQHSLRESAACDFKNPLYAKQREKKENVA